MWSIISRNDFTNLYFNRWYNELKNCWDKIKKIYKLQSNFISEVDGWTNEKKYLIRLDKIIKEYLMAYKKLVFPLQIMKTRVGLNLTKFHCLLHMVYLSDNMELPWIFWRSSRGISQAFSEECVPKNNFSAQWLSIWPNNTSKIN